MLTNTSTFLLVDEGGPACGHGKTMYAVACAETWSGQTIYLLLADCDHESGDYSRVGILFQDDMDDKLRTWGTACLRDLYELSSRRRTSTTPVPSAGFFQLGLYVTFLPLSIRARVANMYLC
jgi:hypothetical protein